MLIASIIILSSIIIIYNTIVYGILDKENLRINLNNTATEGIFALSMFSLTAILLMFCYGYLESKETIIVKPDINIESHNIEYLGEYRNRNFINDNGVVKEIFQFEFIDTDSKIEKRTYKYEYDQEEYSRLSSDHSFKKYVRSNLKNPVTKISDFDVLKVFGLSFKQTKDEFNLIEEYKTEKIIINKKDGYKKLDVKYLD